MLSKAQNTPSKRPSRNKNKALYLLFCVLSSEKLYTIVKKVINVVSSIKVKEKPSIAK